METPTISKKQAKNALSGKKRKVEVIKNVLAKPYQNFWPLLSTEDCIQLNEILEKLLPRLKLPKINIPYKEISSIPKHERKKFRESYNKQTSTVQTKDSDTLVFGVNDVSKLLENREAASVLVASDVQPRLMVQHILDQAVLHDVPLLVVPGLRDILKSKCGVSGAVVALKNTTPDSNLNLIEQCIIDISENYPAPSNHINGHRNVSTITISDSENDVTLEIADSDNTEEIRNFHLKRQGNKRAFVPDKPKQVLPTFLSLESSDVQICHVGKARVSYQPLKVKRLKGDKNRNKRKMQTFKTRVK